jgi:hypothetical protein
MANLEDYSLVVEGGCVIIENFVNAKYILITIFQVSDGILGLELLGLCGVDNKNGTMMMTPTSHNNTTNSHTGNRKRMDESGFGR